MRLGDGVFSPYEVMPSTEIVRSFLLLWPGAVGARRPSPKSAGDLGRTGRTRRWGRGLDQRRELISRNAVMVMVVGALWGNHEATWQ